MKISFNKRGSVNVKTNCSKCACRYLVNPDQTLQIHYVTAQDAGKYTCTAANDVGVVTASAQLLVEGKMMSEEAGFFALPDTHRSHRYFAY